MFEVAEVDHAIGWEGRPGAVVESVEIGSAEQVCTHFDGLGGGGDIDDAETVLVIAYIDEVAFDLDVVNAEWISSAYDSVGALVGADLFGRIETVDVDDAHYATGLLVGDEYEGAVIGGYCAVRPAIVIGVGRNFYGIFGVGHI